MAQVDLVKRIHRNQSLANLSRMSFAIMQVFMKRANTLGKLIQVGEMRKRLRMIKTNSERHCYLNGALIEEKQRPPIVTLSEYRRKYKKDPKWVYV